MPTTTDPIAEPARRRIEAAVRELADPATTDARRAALAGFVLADAGDLADRCAGLRVRLESALRIGDALRELAIRYKRRAKAETAARADVLIALARRNVVMAPDFGRRERGPKDAA